MKTNRRRTNKGYLFRACYIARESVAMTCFLAKTQSGKVSWRKKGKFSGVPGLEIIGIGKL